MINDKLMIKFEIKNVRIKKNIYLFRVLIWYYIASWFSNSKFFLISIYALALQVYNWMETF